MLNPVLILAVQSGIKTNTDSVLDSIKMKNRILLSSSAKALFNDTALFRDATLSCASCHQADSAFTDPRKFSIGVRGQTGTRNFMPLVNLAWKTSCFWDGRAPSLRAQVLMPIEDHTEMDETLERVTAILTAEPGYLPLFVAAFGTSEITAEKISLALEQYLLTLTA